ncbi:transcription termination factor NusA [Candidatus Fermentibacteria bacterium]|nr:transcription termination factor NusA [Candidatus Fermentibacteria bacterium]
MPNFERIDALARLVREKRVNREILLESLHHGLLKATEKEYGSPQEVRVTWNEKTGDIVIQALKEVVNKVTPGEGHLQISKRAAKKIDPDAELGSKVPQPIRIDEFSRGAVNMFRREFLSLVKGAEREQVYEEYSERVGQIIPRCVVQQVYRSRVLVQVAGSIEGVVPVEERARGERYDQGDPITPVLVEVKPPESNEPQLILSRATPLLVQRLFEREAPEIEEGVVEIRGIAREAGVRTKIAVASNDFRVDAVGTFVGMRGTRVQSVMRELNGERIDVLPWTLDKTVLVSHALLPATVMHVETERIEEPEEGQEPLYMIAVVPDDELSLAIGKHGHNVRLAGRLVGARVDVVTQTSWEERKQREKMLMVDLSEMSSVSEKLGERLRLAGLGSANSIAESSEEELLEVKGIGPVLQKKVREEAEKLVEARRSAVEASLSQEDQPEESENEGR